jgi:hypothetical protein
MMYLLQILNGVMNTITLGTYPVRPFLFIGYAVVLASILIVITHLRPRAVWESVSVRTDRVIRILSITSIALLFLISLVTELSVFNAFGIPQKNIALFFAGNEITSTELSHNHFGKSALATLLPQNDEAIVASADTGSALLPYVPKALPYGEVFLFLLALCTSLYISACACLKISGRGKVVAIIILYTLVSFLVLEKSVDGGLLSDGAGVACGIYILLVLKKRSVIRSSLYISIGYVWVLLALHFMGFYWPLKLLTYTFVHSAVFLLIAYTLHYAINGSNRRVKKILAVFALLTVTVVAYVQSNYDRSYLSSVITPGTSYLSAYEREAGLPLPLLGRIGSLVVYDTSPFAGKTVRDVVDTYHLPYWYQPISIYPQNCSMETNRHEERFFLLSRTPLVDSVAVNDLADIAFSPIGNASDGWYRYGVKVTQGYCVPRSLNVLSEMVHLAGTNTLIIYGMQEYLFIPPKTEQKSYTRESNFR